MRTWVYSIFFSKSALLTAATYSKFYCRFSNRLSMKISDQVISPACSALTKLPSLAVFDLDMCLWSPEMYTLNQIPTLDNAVRGKLYKETDDVGIIGVYSGHEVIRLFSGALQILQDVHAGKYGNMRIAIASSADTPLAVSIGRAALDILEVVPGVTVREVFRRGWPTNFEGNIQIGRDYPLSKSKADTHFPTLLRETGIPYHEMIFFDDCIWSDHCGEVRSKCRGVIAEATPRGIQLNEWWNALENYSRS